MSDDKPAGWSRLHEAVHQGDVERVRRVAVYRNVNVKDASKSTPLHVAASREVAEALAERGAKLNVWDVRYRTPLHRAIIDQRSDVAEY